MEIEHYSFGRLCIRGTTYTTDVIIYPDRIHASWWRKTGHNLDIADLTDVVHARPEVLIIGTGASGLMKVPKATIEYMEKNGIKVLMDRTDRAVDLFNRLQRQKKVIAALHLTC